MFLIIQSIRMTAQLHLPCGESKKELLPKKFCMKKGDHRDQDPVLFLQRSVTNRFATWVPGTATVT